ncbi:hypothetical protein N7481_002807 [Penicillium waksmanii]|uniref:uncharacterized protein n=1 Tax=Penicillium waksmanii TaxID=69791 RepID=UPI00254947C8|nr:uncharacterized protein N7481_002807 [Penicillium waksmanii]KAJ5995830.1 hypothetical protein N7481_002807 [Penicillium waksmanii]
MDEHFESALHYGHTGRAIYLPDTRSWSFTRSFKRPSLISNTGLTRTTVPSPLAPAQRQQFIEHLPSAGQGLIPKVLPDLASDWSSVRNDSFSRAVTNTIKSYDPQASTLLDLGYADPALENLNARQNVAIAAAVTGECGNIITFRVMEEDHIQLDDDHPLHIPCIGDDDGDDTEWSRRGAPILQVCFARSLEERPHWMAARLPDVTVIFRPRLYRREAVPIYVPENDISEFAVPRRNSPLDANPVLEISIMQTGGAPHADVTFNPWYPRQFGIVDTEGHWSIWEITGHPRKRKSAFAAKCLKRGSLPWMDQFQDPNGPQYDGWSSIEWVGDVSTVLVSDRRCVMVSPIVGEDSQAYPVELGLTLQSEWVLEVLRSAQNTSHFFVLTTTRLLWFDMGNARPNRSGEMQPLGARLAWRHFRDPEDLTLRLSSVQMGNNLQIVLYSRLTTLVQTFQVPVINEEQTESGSVSDSVMLDIPSTIEVSSLGEISHTPYSTFVFRQVGYAPINPAITEYNTDMTLVKLFWSDSNFAVHETLFRGADAKSDEQDELGEESHGSHVLQLRKKLPNLRSKLKDDDDNDEFIVDDWDESTVAPPTRGDSESLLRPTLSQLAKGLQNNTLSTLTEWNATETMLELSDGRPLLDDIDQGAEDLAGLVATALRFEDTEAQRSFMVLPLHLSKLFHGVLNVPQGARSGLDFLDTYEQLVTDWVTSLPHGINGIPDQTRILKEKMIRQIALDLCLARLIRISNTTDSKAARTVAVESTNQHQPPVNPTKSSSGNAIQLPSSQWQLPSSQILPTQQDSSSQVPPSSAPSAPEEPVHENQNKLYSNLAAFTTFREPRRQPRNVAMLLSHWKPGTDPSTYEWNKTSQMLENEESQRMSAPGTPRRSRSQSKRSRSRSKSVAPEASTSTSASASASATATSASATALPPTPVAPMIRARASQPSWTAVTSSLPMASSQPTLDEVPMTQIERGPFGAREGLKKTPKAKKKRRAAGF